MAQVAEYEQYVRKRITQLRQRQHISEHKMSLTLAKAAVICATFPQARLCPRCTNSCASVNTSISRHRSFSPVPGMNPNVSTFLTDCKTSMTVTYRSCRHSLVGWKKSKSTFCPTSFCLPGFCFCRAYLVERRIAWQMCLTLR